MWWFASRSLTNVFQGFFSFYFSRFLDFFLPWGHSFLLLLLILSLPTMFWPSNSSRLPHKKLSNDYRAPKETSLGELFLFILFEGTKFWDEKIIISRKGNVIRSLEIIFRSLEIVFCFLEEIHFVLLEYISKEQNKLFFFTWQCHFRGALMSPNSSMVNGHYREKLKYFVAAKYIN